MQWTILAPAFFALLFTVIQVGIWLHGRTAASQAARAGAETVVLTAHVSNSHQRGQRDAETIAREAGLKNLDVRIEETRGFVTVTVKATVTLVFPNEIPVAASATLPKEP